MSPQVYVAVDIMTFRSTTRDINFDVFLRLGDENYAHVFSRTTGLDYKRLAQYITKGVRELYLKPEDMQSYQMFIAKSAQHIFEDPNTSNEKKIATLLNMTEQNMSEIFAQVTLHERTAESTKKLVRDYVNLLTETPQTLAILLKLVAHGDYLYYHSVAVAIFSMFIAKASGQFNSKMLELVGMGGFLHDIGSTQIPKDVVCSPTELTPEQWKYMRQHSTLGMKMVEGTANIPDEVRYIIYQHHEEPGGHGYPNQLHGANIYYPAKIVAIADAFSALISKRPFRPAYTVEKAIEIIQTEVGKYDRELVRLLGSTFLRGNQGTKKAA